MHLGLGLTWLDWLVLVLVLAFAVRGLLSGFTSQVFGVLGLVAGLWTAGWMTQWVGTHWQGGQPAVVFTLLRWLVAALAALLVAALVQAGGTLVGTALSRGPAGWVDRPGGLVLGAGTGALVAAFALLGALLVPWSDPVAAAAARSRTARPMLHGAASACALAGRFVPGGAWLGERFDAAERRVRRAPRVS